MRKRARLNAAGRKPNRVRFYRRDDAYSDPMDELEWEDRVLMVGMRVWAWNGDYRRLGTIIELGDLGMRVRYDRPRPDGFESEIAEENFARFGKDEWALIMCVQLHEEQPLAVELKMLKRKYPDRH